MENLKSQIESQIINHKSEIAEGGGIKIRAIKAFSLVELIIVISIIGILSVVSFVALQSAGDRSKNNKVLADLHTIAVALDNYKRDHEDKYPIPKSGSNQNILCYYEDATYAHSCDKKDALFVQGMIDNSLLTKRYLRDVPVDPRTGSRYAYGVTADGAYFQTAGIYKEDDTFTARTAGNLAKGFQFPGIIRSYNSPEFVTDKGKSLPYSPDKMSVTGSLANIKGTVTVPKKTVTEGLILTKGDTIITKDGSADIYFSEGSITHVDKNTKLVLKELKVMKNDKSGTSTGVILGIDAGKIWNKVTRLSAKSEFNVETTTAIAGVRGTEFGIEQNTGSDPLVTVLSGTIDFYADANSLKLKTIADTATGTIAGPTAYTVAKGGKKTASATSLLGIMGDYYKDIPLNVNMTPRILSAKYDTTSKKGIINIRNIDYYADRVDDALGLKAQNIKRSVIADTLIAYQNKTGTKIDVSLPLTGLTGSYELKGLTPNTPLYLRFEDSKSKRKSGLTIPITIKPNTNLTESEIYSRSLAEVAKLTGPPKLTIDTYNFAETKEKFDLKTDISPYTYMKGDQYYVSLVSGTCKLSKTGSIKFKLKKDKKQTIKVTAPSSPGSCKISVRADVGGAALTKMADIRIFQEQKKLILTYPAPGSGIKRTVLKKAGKPITFRWKALNPPANVEYYFSLKRTNPLPIKTIIPFQSTKKITSYTAPGSNFVKQNHYTWTVDMHAGPKPSKTIMSKTGYLEIKHGVGVDFTMSSGGKQLANQDTLPASGPTTPITVNAPVINTLAAKKYTYQWTLSGFVKPLPNLNTAQFTADVKVAQGSSQYAGITLTVRDDKNNLVDTVTKGVTVSDLPILQQVAFQTKNETLTQAKKTFKVSKLLVVKPSAAANINIPLSKCQWTYTAGGSVAAASGTYTAPSSATLPTDTVTCTLKQGEVINGYKVGANIKADIVVNLPSAGPGLAKLCAAGSGKMIGGNCWIKGGAGKSCTQACTTVKLSGAQLKCDPNTSWNDTNCNACKAFNTGASCLGYPGTLSPAPNPSGAPFVATLFGTTACRYRDKGIQNCATPPTFNSMFKSPARICKCIK